MVTTFGHDEDFFGFSDISLTFKVTAEQNVSNLSICQIVVGRHLFSLKRILVSVFNVGNRRTHADDKAHMIWHVWKEKFRDSNLLFVASFFILGDYLIFYVNLLLSESGMVRCDSS